MGRRRKYTDEQRARALEAAASRGDRTLEEVASDLGIPISVIVRWRSEARTTRARSDEDRVDKMRRLRREAERLAARNEEMLEAEVAALRRENARLRRTRRAAPKEED